MPGTILTQVSGTKAKIVKGNSKGAGSLIPVRHTIFKLTKVNRTKQALIERFLKMNEDVK